ncbi:hypothetical protein H6P81_009776 [Aristolochia fimbriata]|uniref:Uncharacterized protein n=1 Tax=Aristolochia fimbriata TaxID=158543 RepID=A0AAV7EMY2_ARIFI|nr:hypothetical protein H6P81_009776 [Aristolochia fimbriata]
MKLFLFFFFFSFFLLFCALVDIGRKKEREWKEKEEDVLSHHTKVSLELTLSICLWWEHKPQQKGPYFLKIPLSLGPTYLNAHIFSKLGLGRTKRFSTSHWATLLTGVSLVCPAKSLQRNKRDGKMSLTGSSTQRPKTHFGLVEAIGRSKRNVSQIGDEGMHARTTRHHRPLAFLPRCSSSSCSRRHPHHPPLHHHDVSHKVGIWGNLRIRNEEDGRSPCGFDNGGFLDVKFLIEIKIDCRRTETGNE